MSQTSPNPADQTATNRRVTNHREIKPLFIGSHVGVNTTIRSDNMQIERISRPQTVKNQRFPRHCWQGLSFTAKTVALVIAVLTLPVLANRTSAYYFTNQSITEQSTPASPARANQPADFESVQRRQLPLTLVVETVVAALLLVGLLAAYLANRAMRPTLTATAIAKKSSQEEPHSPAPLATQDRFALNQASLSEQQEVKAEQTQLLTEITLRIRQSLYLEDVLRTTVKEVRRALKTDRVIIYGLDPTNWEGTVVAESVAPGWAQTLRVKINDPCFREGQVELYKKGRIRAINNIYQEPGLADGHIKLLEQFAVKSNLVAPIVKNDQLLGLMIAHHCSEPRTWEKSDIDLFAQLAMQVGLAVDQASISEQQEAETERVQLLTEITLRIHQSLYLEDILKTAVKEVRRALKTERVIIYGLDPTNWDGIVVAESVAPGLAQTLRVRIDDPCFRDRHVQMYKNGHVRAIDDIYQEPGLQDCYIKMLEQFSVKANLVAPILKDNQLLGLMIAHHCSEPRTWQKLDVDLFVQLATQVGFAVDQASLREHMEQAQAS